MEIKRCILKDNDVVKADRRIYEYKGIVVHSTGANNPWLLRYVQPSDDDLFKDDLLKSLGKNRYGNHWNRSVGKCVHFMIGKEDDGTVACYQIMPLYDKCGGVATGLMIRAGATYYSDTDLKKAVGVLSENVKGTSFDSKYTRINFKLNGTQYYAKYSDGLSYNTDHLQFEMCEDDLTNEAYFNSVMTLAQKLCAYLCDTYELSVDTICSHKEAHNAGYASNHGDCDNWLVKYGKDMNWFRDCVAKILEENKKPQWQLVYEDTDTRVYKLK